MNVVLEDLSLIDGASSGDVAGPQLLDGTTSGDIGDHVRSAEMVKDSPLVRREPIELVEEFLTLIQLKGWVVDRGSTWTHAFPSVPNRRLQGWKLHVSATVVSAPEVLKACAPILIEARTHFKFASNARSLLILNDRRCPRGSSGKFITAYPSNDGQLSDLAARLHQATVGIAGPVVLSDAPYLKGSLVHYRYGAFDGLEVLTNDGMYSHCIIDPDGNPVEDRRPATFTPPPWAVSPFADPVTGSDPTEEVTPESSGQSGNRIILHDRYEISVAIRHSNGGGVYPARDRITGDDVILKEARPHVGTDEFGRDAVDMLRHEACVLKHVAPLGIAPALLDEFTQESHYFLVQELVRGHSLRQRADASPRRLDGGLTQGELIDIAVRLACMLQELHRGGVVVRDFSPNNIMLTPSGDLRVIDLEMAAVWQEETGSWAVFGIGGGTPGISAPEQFKGAMPDYAADLFSLGATLLFLVIRNSPEIMADHPVVRSLEARVADMLSPPGNPFHICESLRQIITGLMREKPGERVSLGEVIRLGSSATTGHYCEDLWRWPPTAKAVSDLARLSNDDWSSLVSGIIGYLTANLPTNSRTSPWSETSFGQSADCCTVQHGLAGGLAVLVRLVGIVGEEKVRDLLDAVLVRITRQLEQNRHRLPGLYFGFAGTAWALFDAGTALHRPDLVSRSLDLVASLPTAWPNPDVTHGLSGLGSCLLYLAERTGRTDLLARALACAEEILSMADSGDDAISWTVPPSFNSQLAGYSSYGFAHGTAGIGAFLLAAGHAGGRNDLQEAAERCGETLLASAIYEGDAAFWPATPTSSIPLTYWCNGSGGVGTFLCRLYARTEEQRYRTAAVAAARAVMRTRWNIGTAYCHGLAGNGDFLIDLACVTGDSTFLTWAEEMAGLLWTKRVYRDGFTVLPDGSGAAVTGGYGAGLSGHLSFLVRLRSRSSRLFHPDL
jgi:serine/threonine protein kinase